MVFSQEDYQPLFQIRRLFQFPSFFSQTATASSLHLSGLLPTDACPHIKKEWFIAGTQPTTSDTFYQRTVSGDIVLNIPIEAQDWARSQGLPLLDDANGASFSTNLLILTSPVDNTTYRLTPDLCPCALRLGKRVGR
jgi:hypothetical protein